MNGDLGSIAVLTSGHCRVRTFGKHCIDERESLPSPQSATEERDSQIGGTHMDLVTVRTAAVGAQEQDVSDARSVLLLDQ